MKGETSEFAEMDGGRTRHRTRSADLCGNRRENPWVRRVRWAPIIPPPPQKHVSLLAHRNVEFITVCRQILPLLPAVLSSPE